MGEGTVVIEKLENGIAFIILDKQDVMNAIDPGMMDQLVDCLKRMEKDEEVEVIILKGQGNCFGSGGDLSNIISEDIRELRLMMKHYGQAIWMIQCLEKPVIAQIEGNAFGGSMSLALACDMIIAAENATFSSVFLQLGLIPEMGSLIFLPQAVGMYRAKELWFTERIITAKEAYEMGFVNRIFPENKIEEETIAFALEITRRPQFPLRVTKRLANSFIYRSLNNLLESESLFAAYSLAAEDHKKLIKAFRGKQKK